MIPDGMELKVLVCEGPVQPEAVSALPPYIDLSSVGAVLDTARDVRDVQTGSLASVVVFLLLAVLVFGGSALLDKLREPAILDRIRAWMRR